MNNTATTKLTEAMKRTLIEVAERGSTILWGRGKASAIALDKRGLIRVVHCVRSEGSGEGLRVEIKDSGYELAVALV